jgi:predicted dehydrogenase
VVLDVLKAGKHVLSEKPMAHTAEQAARLVKAAADNNLVYSVGFMKRHDEGTAVAKKMLDELTASNELGRIILMRGYCFCGDFNVHPEGFVMTGETRPDGLTLWPVAPDWLPPQYTEDYAWFLNVFVHDLNLLRYFAGQDLKVRGADLSRRNGRVALLETSAFPVMLEMGEQAGTDWTEGVDIQFEKGRLTIQLPSPLIENKSAAVTLTRGKDTIPLDTGASWSFRRQAEAFVADVAGRRAPLASGADSVADLALVERIWRVYLGLA